MMGQTYFEWLGQAPPVVQVNQLITGGWIAQAIGVAAELGIADLLIDGPKSGDELARATGSHPRALYRLLRALAGVGIFTEVEPEHFGLTPMADVLRSDAPVTLRGLARLVTGDVQWRTWGQLGDSVRTGQPAFERVHGVDFWEYRAQHPEAGALFNAAMTGMSSLVANAVAAAYDFSGAGTVVDVGGGQGAMLIAILRANPELRGVVFDLPHVAAGAETAVTAAGLRERCAIAGGDMFEQVPPGGDIYLLSYIIHDWDDERSVAILTNCRQAMGPGGRLLLIEDVIPPGDTPSHGKLMDLNMLVSLGGQERTEAEYRALCAAAGFTLTRVIPTRSPRSIIEAEPA
jgi:hypothetical protein